MADILVDLTGDGTWDKDLEAGGLTDISDETGDGKLDVNLTGANSFASIGGALFSDAANVGAGTGNYNTFLALQDDNDADAVEAGFNAGQSGGGAQANPEDDSNDEMDASKSEVILLGAIPIKIVDGVAYYEFRTDLNEANSGSATLISLDQFKLYVGPYDLDTDPPNPVPSTSGQNDDNIDLVDTVGELGTLTKVYDMDAEHDVSVLMDEGNSSGSGNDDYVVLVPVSNFAGYDPATTYVYLYVQMGAAGGDGDGDGAIGDSGDDQTWIVNGGFHEWNLQNALIIQGTKFNDLDADGVRDPGEPGLEGVTIYIDDDLDGVVEATDNNGVLDVGEQFDITDVNGNYSFGGIPIFDTDYTIYIREVVPAGYEPTTTLPVEVLIDSAAAAGSIIDTSDVPGLLIGNANPIDLSGTKYLDLTGDGITGDDTGLGGFTIFIDLNDNEINDEAAAYVTITAADGTWSFTGLGTNVIGHNVYEVQQSGYVQTVGTAGITITGDATGLDFANFELFDISGTKYTDITGDGLSGDDTVLGGVTIFIDVDGNNIDDDGYSTVTLGDGTYSFTDLDYSVAGAEVKEITPTGYVQTVGQVGTVTDTSALYLITGTSGEDQTGLDFANFLPDPKIDLIKYVDVGFGWDDANTGPGPNNVNIGGDVDFKVTIENTGNVSLTEVDVNDTYLSGGAPGTANLLVDNGALTAYALAHNGVLTGDDNDGDAGNGLVADGILQVGETWTITYTEAFDPLAFDPGEHLNTADVTTAEGAEDEDSAYYYSLVDEGLCPRTPGFWQNPNNGAQFWDGVAGNEKNLGKDGFPEGELLYAIDSDGDGVINAGVKGLLIGDYNKNGIADSFGLDLIAGNADDVQEDVLYVSYADAQTLINASNKQLNGSSGDGRFMLGRDMVASWLNYLQGSGFGEASDPQSPHHYLDDAIDWMQIYSGNTAAGAGETFDSLKLNGGNIKTNTATWTTPQSGIDHSASQMHSALDYYNNTGQTQPDGVHYANCETEHLFEALSVYQDSHSLI